MKHNRTTLKKIESIYLTQGYRIRYEKGHFESGHCIVRQSRIVLINKFFDTEGRIQKLLDILTELEISEELLNQEQRKYLNSLVKEWNLLPL